MNEQNMKLVAVKKRCNTAAKIVGVIQVFTIVCAAIALIAGIMLFVKGGSINPYLQQEVAEGKLTTRNTIEYNGLFHFFADLDEKFEEGNYAGPMAVSCLAAGLACVLVAVIVTFIKRIFVVVREENSPFSNRAMKQIKTGFIVMTIAALLTMSLGVAIVTGFILFCIYAIFEYGAALQNEIDETL